MQLELWKFCKIDSSRTSTLRRNKLLLEVVIWMSAGILNHMHVIRDTFLGLQRHRFGLNDTLGSNWPNNIFDVWCRQRIILEWLFDRWNVIYFERHWRLLIHGDNTFPIACYRVLRLAHFDYLLILLSWNVFFNLFSGTLKLFLIVFLLACVGHQDVGASQGDVGADAPDLLLHILTRFTNAINVFGHEIAGLVVYRPLLW